jgi:hypothetical protein
MKISDVFVQLGDDAFGQLLKGISMGKLKTYQLYVRFKTRTHLNKLNTENLKKSGPTLMGRLRGQDEELATDLSQAILISHFDMIVAVLDHLSIPHEDGFFVKDLNPGPYLTEGWQDRVFQNFHGKFPDALLLFYINHLGVELANEEKVYLPAAA